jgi:hypothetical protein
MTPLARRKKISTYITAVLQEVRYRKLLNDFSLIEQMVSLFLFGETDVTRSDLQKALVDRNRIILENGDRTLVSFYKITTVENLTTTGLNDDEIDALEFFSWLEDRFDIVRRSEMYF